MFNTQKYVDFFTSITSYTPYPYQIAVAKAILDKKHVILKAPTGSGKTLAVVMPFFYSCIENIPFADKIIYTLPMRSIANDIYNKIINLNIQNVNEDNCVLHTGDSSIDPLLKSKHIFTTIDQILASFIGSPYGIGSSRYNINQGSLIGSYIILDEFHLYDIDKLAHTSLAMIDKLQKLSQFVIMSATISDSALNILKNNIDDVCEINISNNEINELRYNIEKRIYYKSSCIIDLVPEIINKYIQNNNKTIIIMNTIEKAQEIIHYIKDYINKNNLQIDIYTIHSEFLKVDRHTKEIDITNIYSKTSFNNGILISTQVLEAGVDITCDNLYTELAPINSILQRIGRCARYSKEYMVYGNIYICNIADCDFNGNSQCFPYSIDNPALMKLILLTQKLIQQKNNTILTYQDEINLINEINNTFDRDSYNKIIKKYDEYQNTIIEYNNCYRSRYIRNINNSNICIISKDQIQHINLINQQNNTIETLSINTDKLKNKIKKMPENAIYYQFNNVEDDAINSILIEKNKNDLNYDEIIFILSEYASYTYLYGIEFIKNIENNYMQINIINNSTWKKYEYDRETWIDHSIKSINASHQLLYMHNIALEKLSTFYHLSINELKNKIIYAVAYHDTGKLNDAWQSEAKKVQHINDPHNTKNIYNDNLAHTTFNHIHNYRGDFVDHSYVSAFINSILFYSTDKLNNIDKCFITAIAKHHSSGNMLDKSKIQAPDIKLNIQKINADILYINKYLNTLLNDNIVINLSLNKSYSYIHVIDFITTNNCYKIKKINDTNYYMLLWFIIRIIRLSDQASNIKI